MKTSIFSVGALACCSLAPGVLGQVSVTFANANPGTPPTQNPIITSAEIDFVPPYPFDLNMYGDPRVLTINAEFSATTTVSYQTGVGSTAFEVSISQVTLTLFGAGLVGGKFDVDLTPVNAFTPVLAPGQSGPASFFKAVTETVSVAGGGIQSFELKWSSSTAQVIPQNDKSAGSSTVYGIDGGVVVPEPAEFALMAGLGLLGFGLWRRNRG